MIPFLDIQAQYEAIRSELELAVLDVLKSGEYVLGSRVVAFERDFTAYCGTEHAVALNSGTSATEFLTASIALLLLSSISATVAALIRLFTYGSVIFIQRCPEFDGTDLALVGSRTIALSFGPGDIL